MIFKIPDEKIIEYIKFKKKKYGGSGVLTFSLWVLGLFCMIRVPTALRLISWIIMIVLNASITITAHILDIKRTLQNENLFESLFCFNLTIFLIMTMYNMLSYFIEINFWIILLWLICYLIFSILIILLKLNKIMKISFENNKNKVILQYATTISLLIYPFTRVLIKLTNTDQTVSILALIVFLASFFTLKLFVDNFMLYYFQKKLKYDEELEIEEDS